MPISGLNDKNDPRLPIIADGFVENEPGTYTDDRLKKGGVWKGTKAILVFVDGSAQPIAISEATHFHVLRTMKGHLVDRFTREGGLPEGARVLNPE